MNSTFGVDEGTAPMSGNSGWNLEKWFWVDPRNNFCKSIGCIALKQGFRRFSRIEDPIDQMGIGSKFLNRGFLSTLSN